MNGPAPRVLMTTDTVGGVWTYALDLGRGLAQAGVEVTLAVSGPAPDDRQHAQAAAAGLVLEALGGALDWTATHKGDVAAPAARLFQLSARLRPDLIHLNSPALGAFGPFHAPVLAACHSCVKTWWQAVKGDAPFPDDLAWRAALVELGYENATALAAPSRAFATATRAAYGLAALPHVIPNGRSFPLEGGGFGWGSRAGEGRGPMDQADVLTAGRLWDDGKDLATLDRAVGRADFRADAAGPLAGPNGHAVTFRHLRSLGRLSDADLQTRLAHTPIFVSPSRYEPFGLAVLEAAQAGCPLVLSDIATFRELWDGAALFFPPGDDAALADTLTTLSADRDRRTRQGHAAQLRAARYTAQAMVGATIQLYAALSPAFVRREAAA